MILRKPYAFFIKHFKIFHIILLLILGYLIFKTNLILNFLNNYLELKQVIIGKKFANSLFPNNIYFLLTILILISILFLVIMKIKKRRPIYYLFNIILGFLLIYIFIYSHGVISLMEEKVVALKTIRLVRDFLTLSLLAQSVSLIICFIRIVGFNVRKLDFDDSSNKIEIDDRDNEEFELELNMDTSSLRRKINKKKRYFKYTYKEHKLLINFLILFIILFITIVVPLILNNMNKKYTEKDAFTVDNYNIGVKNSFIIENNYKGKIIKPNSKFIVLKVMLRNNSINENRFKITNSYLKVGKEQFNHTFKYLNEFIDLGEVYNKQKLTNEFKDYLFVYELPANYEIKDSYFEYVVNKKKYKVKLNPKQVKEENKIKEYSIGQEIIIKELSNTLINITNYEIEPFYKIDYNFCVDSNECYNSKEYLYPSFTGRDKKAILKINGIINIKEDGLQNMNMDKFIKSFGVIRYETNRLFKEQNIITSLKTDNSNKKDYYFEVNYNVLNSRKVYLDFVFRNNIYRYTLK